MPRFVVLWHEAGPALDRPSHFDLLFEDGDAARTWFVEQNIEPGIDILAGELPRHRLFYFDYEGPVSGDRGIVSRWDRGDYRVIQTSDNCFEAELFGEQLVGSICLTRYQHMWKLRFSPRDASNDVHGRPIE